MLVYLRGLFTYLTLKYIYNKTLYRNRWIDLQANTQLFAKLHIGIGG